MELHLRSKVDQSPGPYVVALAARDLIELHMRAFSFNSIPVPPVRAFRGLELLDGLQDAVRIVAGWMGEAA